MVVCCRDVAAHVRFRVGPSRGPAIVCEPPATGLFNRYSLTAEVEKMTMVNRVSWKQVGSVKEPGRYMLRFGCVTITAEDLAIWEQHPEATFTLYEVAVDQGNDEYRGAVLASATRHRSSRTPLSA